jgi:dienelactone hydrolase
VLVGPESANPDGWLASEADEVLADVRAVARECGADADRVVAVGVGAGGRMAYHLGFTAGDFVRGVAAVGADLGTKPRDPEPGRPLWLFLGVGEKDTRREGVTATAGELRKLGYVVTLNEMKGVAADTLDAETVGKLGVWLDFLDRI